VTILAQSMTTDTASSFDGRSMISLVGADMAKAAADAVYAQAGVGPEDIDVCELHDCFAHNELISYEALGFCAPGEAARFVADGSNTYGGPWSRSVRRPVVEDTRWAPPGCAVL
jgi:acetyl-CoA acetyltransferase